MHIFTVAHREKLMYDGKCLRLEHFVYLYTGFPLYKNINQNTKKNKDKERTTYHERKSNFSLFRRIGYNRDYPLAERNL